MIVGGPTDAHACIVCAGGAERALQTLAGVAVHGGECLQGLLLAPFTEVVSEFRRKRGDSLSEVPDVVLALHGAHAITLMQSDALFAGDVLKGRGVPWGALLGRVADWLPEAWSKVDRETLAHHLVSLGMCALYGQQGYGWFSELIDTRAGEVRMVRARRRRSGRRT